MSTLGNSEQYAREHRREIIAMTKKRMVNESLDVPVRLEFGRLPTDDTFVGIAQRGANIWLVAPDEKNKKRTGNVKVERTGKDAWTCSCQGWQKARGTDCKHISRVRFMIGDGGAIPYDGRRRRLRTAMLYKEGPTEATRRAKARSAEAVKVPLLAAELCERFAPQPPRSTTHPGNRGATGVPLPARVHALLMKIFWNVSYEELRQRLNDQGMMWELGMRHAEIPHKCTLVRWFGSEDLTEALERIFDETTKPTRRFDTMVMGDSHDIPTRMVDNSRDRKFGPKQPAYRDQHRALVRQHFVVGKVSNIIYAADTSLNGGLGSGDAPHLPRLLERTKKRAAGVCKAAFDHAYDGRPNFTAAEEMGIDLYVKEKRGEDRTDESWPEMARTLTELERTNPAAYAEVYRFRSKAEATPSRLKAHNPYIRLRRRNGDPTPSFPEEAEKKKAISDLPREVQDALFDAATQSVGIARLNESLAILIVANLRALNVLEHLYDQHVTFEHDVTINPPVEMHERDVNEAA